MMTVEPIVWCIAFICGLFVSSISWGGWIALLAGGALTVVMPRFWRSGVSAKTWIIAGAIALLATVYFHLRLPHPAPTDISNLLSPGDKPLNLLVEGEVLTMPHLGRNEKVQFWLNAQRVAPINDGKPVTGKLYVTVPQTVAPTLHPKQLIQVSGSLYLPTKATNPGGFDFKEFLQTEGSFAGFRGDRVEILQDSNTWGIWQIQQRIVTAQQQGLGSPEGALVSAMVLGGRAVDLPYLIKDAFVRVGLAHALAASGFQTSLILGVILALTRRSSERIQFLAGSAALAGFLALAGFQPSVLRATVMGFGSLLALLMSRKVKPLGSLLLTATILLLVCPGWIYDLGFQLSFLATLGLLVTAPALTKRLDWLPTAIAPMIAVPIAAYLWTLPLQLNAFGVLSPYSIPANLLTTPLISGISLGGMISALAALIWPPAGRAIAWCLKYPTQWLIAIVQGFSQLPGNAFAVGTISVLTVIVLYGLLVLTTAHPKWQQRWWATFTVGCILLLVPLWAGANLTQITILATNRSPVMVLRNQGNVLVMGGSEENAQFTVLPFLQKSGLNQIDYAIARDATAQRGFNALLQWVPVKYLLNDPLSQNSLPQADDSQKPHQSWVQVSSQPEKTFSHSSPTLIPFTHNQIVKLGNIQISSLSTHPAITQFTLKNQTWLWLGSLNAEEQDLLVQRKDLPTAHILWFSNQSIRPEIIDRVQPKTAIASTKVIKPETIDAFQQRHISLYVTGLHGSVQWSPQAGFNTLLEHEPQI